ncbi:MAG: DUF4920 domain-containing protein [Candidatus Competibacteraceae bacterium]|nr:DUF4920 domain-containing protein [Candidatus Competibacteraceae bacterium]
MKYSIMFLLSALLLLASCGGKAEKPVDKSLEGLSFFGDSISPDGAINVEEMIAMMNEKDSAEVKVSSTIVDVCQKKGCWMDLALPNDDYMTVKFKDYEFFVPKDAEGKTAIIEGIVRKEVETVEWLKHKAEDAGQSQEEIDAITEPKTSFTFEASGVIIK